MPVIGGQTLVKFRGWKYCKWESLKDQKEIKDRLETIIVSKYGLRLVSFVREEAEIARKHRLPNPHYYVAHEPDIIFSDGTKPKDRIVLEYANTKSMFLFDLRGMIALSNVYEARRFILAIRHSIFPQYSFTNLHEKTNVEAMSLKSLLFGLDVSLDEGNLNYLCDIYHGKTL